MMSWPRLYFENLKSNKFQYEKNTVSRSTPLGIFDTRFCYILYIIARNPRFQSKEYDIKVSTQIYFLKKHNQISFMIYPAHSRFREREPSVTTLRPLLSAELFKALHY